MNVGEIIKARKCRHCKEPVCASSTQRCEKHNDAHRADSRRRVATRRLAGLCACGANPAPGFTRCQPCRAKQKASQGYRRATGNCIRCALGNRAAAAGMCVGCWFKKIANDCLRARGSALQSTADMLRLLWEKQDGRCALTGETLVPGITASLDHRVPRSQGGTHEAANLQWVTFSVNMAKHALSQDEFLSLCRRVIAHQERP